MPSLHDSPIKAIIGLGNPGQRYDNTRHNIGFHVVDELAAMCGADWQEKNNMMLAKCSFNDISVLLIKPQTFMNDSGDVIPFLLKQSIKPENILVVHDELELPFGTIKFRIGGGARGHNGLRSIMAVIGKDFPRLSFGIGRPEHKEEVPDYVLARFSQDPAALEQAIKKAAEKINELVVVENKN